MSYRCWNFGQVLPRRRAQLRQRDSGGLTDLRSGKIQRDAVVADVTKTNFVYAATAARREEQEEEIDADRAGLLCPTRGSAANGE